MPAFFRLALTTVAVKVCYRTSRTAHMMARQKLKTAVSAN